MANIDDLRRVDLAPAEIPAALALSDLVGWNQTREDWAVFIARGRTIGLCAPDGALVATAAALPYSAGFGWISMVIVAPAWRRRGLARRLMDECVATLRGARRAALLDATPAGALVYHQLGFRELCRLERWQGEGRAMADCAERNGFPARLRADEIERLIAADGDAFGAERGFLLRNFLAREGAAGFACEGSYLVMRPGHRATQIGPLVASTLDAAQRLLAAAISTARGTVFLDLLERWNDLGRLLEARNFTRQRPYVRMALDRSTLPGDPERLAIAAGPEFG
jgi:GNAT superfamily N-acetyltransferase